MTSKPIEEKHYVAYKWGREDSIVCYICDNPEVKLTDNERVYGRKYGNGKCYLCEECGAYVGVHRRTWEPLGITATKSMRQKKMQCHKLFDPIHRKKLVKRNQLYKRLAKRMDIPRKECHFGHMNHERLDQAIEIMIEPGWYVEEEK